MPTRPDISTYYLSGGDFRLIATGAEKTAEKILQQRGIHTLRIPEQRGIIKIHPQFFLQPNFANTDQLMTFVDRMGVVVFKPLVVDNYFGTFRSKEPLVTSIVHGGIVGPRHVVSHNIDSQDYFRALKDKLLEMEIRPPDIFISCDAQTEQQGNFPIRFIRFTQKGESGVLAFPYLINLVSTDASGTVTVHERDMKQEAKANSGSPFANPLDADIRLLNRVEELFECPERFKELLQQRVESEIKIGEK